MLARIFSFGLAVLHVAKARFTFRLVGYIKFVSFLIWARALFTFGLVGLHLIRVLFNFGVVALHSACLFFVLFIFGSAGSH